MPNLKTNPSTTLRTGVLYYGDNLEVLRRHIPDESVDLVYLDPPFNSSRSYNVLFRESSDAARDAYHEVVTGPHQEVAWSLVQRPRELLYR